MTGAALAGGLAAPAAMASTAPKAAQGTDPTITIRVGGVRTAENGGLDLTKTARPRTYTHAGEQVTYTYTVTNTKYFTLHDVHVTDDRVHGPISCTPSRIATGEMATCTATYTITRADVRRGHVTNTAIASGKTPNDDEVASGPADATVRAKQKAAILLVKSASPHAYRAPGQTITYTYLVTNTGNVTLHGIKVTDNKIHGPIACPVSTLAPGKWMTCHAVHTTTRADVRAGHIRNVALAVGWPPRGAKVTARAEANVVGRTLPVVPVTG
jgi:hypothetical protein